MSNEAGVGCSAGADWTDGKTWVSQYNPSEAGSVTALRIQVFTTAGQTFQWAFFTASGDNLTTNETVDTTASTTSGEHCELFESPGAFTSFSVVANEYLGVYPSTLYYKYVGSLGTNGWWKSGDNIPCSSAAFTANTNNPAIGADITAAAGKTGSGSGAFNFAGTNTRLRKAFRQLTGAW